MIDFRPWSPPALLWLFAARSALSCVQLWARFWGLGERARAETTIVPFRGGPAAPARAGAAAGQLIRFARAPAPARTR